MKILILIILAITIISVPALAKNRKMKGKDNKIESHSGLMGLGLVAKNTLEVVEGLIKVAAAQQDQINKLEEQLDYMAVRIGKLEEKQGPVVEGVYPINKPNKNDYISIDPYMEKGE